jgi:hypothetical protein
MFDECIRFKLTRRTVAPGMVAFKLTVPPPPKDQRTEWGTFERLMIQAIINNVLAGITIQESIHDTAEHWVLDRYHVPSQWRMTDTGGPVPAIFGAEYAGYTVDVTPSGARCACPRAEATMPIFPTEDGGVERGVGLPCAHLAALYAWLRRDRIDHQLVIEICEGRVPPATILRAIQGAPQAPVDQGERRARAEHAYRLLFDLPFPEPR